MSNGYISKKFLPADHLPSTSTVACYHGIPSWECKDYPDRKEKFVEVSSCGEKCRLHQIDIETDQEFKEKIVRLRDELSKYIEYLEGI